MIRGGTTTQKKDAREHYWQTQTSKLRLPIGKGNLKVTGNEFQMSD